MHAGGVVVRQDVVRRPERFQLPAGGPERRRAGAVRRRGEDQVADHQRRGRVHGRPQPRAPALLEADGAAGRVEADQALAREEDGETLAADVRRHAGGVARLVRRGGPQHVAGIRVERRDAGVAAADVGDDPAVLHHRRAGRAEETLADAETLCRVDVPEQLAGLQVDGGEPALRPERDDAPAGRDRHGARPLVEPEVVAVGGRRVVAPERFARRGVQRLQHLPAFEAVEEQHAPARHRRSGEPFADGPPPQLRRTAAGPLGGERGSVVASVAVRPEPLRPVAALRPCRQGQDQRQQHGRQRREHGAGARHRAPPAPSVMRYSFEAVRMNRLPCAIAGVAIVNSPSGLAPSSSNCGPALMTYVSPSSLSANILPS